MAVTVGKLLENATVLYGMKLLAGQKGLNNLVEWVHIVEDSNVSKFLHGNEIIFTAGILNKYDDWLLEYVKLLNKAGASAFVVNLGPYIKEISKEVIEYCDNVNMPLFSMPWETKMVDVTRDVCYKIMKKNQVEMNVTEIIKNILFKVGDMETQIDLMERNGYRRDSRFCFILMSFKDDQSNISHKERDKNEIQRYSERIARSINELYISFSHNGYNVLVLVNYSDDQIKDFINKFFENMNFLNNNWKIHISVSDNKKGIEGQDENLNMAFRAMKIAENKDLKVIFYNELDIYKLLINIKDKELIKEFYESVFGSLERYDEKNNTNLMDFLKIYLDSNGSQQLVAEKQFIHRNTVNNMIKKIYKITGHNPAELGDKMKFLIGFYIKDII